VVQKRAAVKKPVAAKAPPKRKPEGSALSKVQLSVAQNAESPIPAPQVSYAPPTLLP
jgi:hypothetical protein